MATKPMLQNIEWKSLLYEYERSNPKGFGYYYHFHSIYGLEEDDLSPFERLQEIGENSENDFEQICSDFKKAACSVASLEYNEDSYDYQLDEEGISISFIE